MNKIVLVCLTIALSINAFSQRQEDYAIRFEQIIEAILINPYNGEIIIKNISGISSFDQESKEQTWALSERDIASKNILGPEISRTYISPLFTSSEKIEFIQNSPYFKTTFGFNDAILNSLNGEVVFNSIEIPARILKGEFLAEQEAFLFLVQKKKMMSFIYYDLKAKKILWERDLDPVNAYNRMLESSFKEITDVEDQILIVGEAIYSAANGFLYKIDRNTGDIHWKTDFRVQRFTFSQSGEKMIVILDTGGIFAMKQSLNVLDTKNGSKLWENNISSQYISYIEVWDDRILIAHQDGFNFYSYATGDKIWDKDAIGKNIKKVIPIETDYLYLANKEMHFIDRDGKSKWNKSVKLSNKKANEVYYLKETDNNQALYLTDTYGNSVDLAKGEKTGKTNVKFNKKRPLAYAYDEGENVFWVYNNKRIYKFDSNVTEIPENLGNKTFPMYNDKTIQEIELFDWGICIIGQNDIIGVDYDGNTIYHNTYKEPGKTARHLLKPAAFLGSFFYVPSQIETASRDYSNFTIQYRDADANLVSKTSDRNYDKGEDKLSNVVNLPSSQGEGILKAAVLINKVRHRYNALKTNADYAFIFTRGENGESTQLVKVRKSDGKEIDKITIDNNKPIYEIDPVTNTIFYVSKNKIKVFTEK